MVLYPYSGKHPLLVKSSFTCHLEKQGVVGCAQMYLRATMNVGSA